MSKDRSSENGVPGAHRALVVTLMWGSLIGMLVYYFIKGERISIWDGIAMAFVTLIGTSILVRF
jgi:hypothetical protein